MNTHSIPMTRSTGDLRSIQRQPFAGRVTCVSNGQYELAGLDISPAGIGLLSPRPFQPGQRITLLFRDGAHAIEGVVVSVRTLFISDWQIGITFLEQQADLLETLRAA